MNVRMCLYATRHQRMYQADIHEMIFIIQINGNAQGIMNSNKRYSMRIWQVLICLYPRKSADFLCVQLNCEAAIN